MLLENYDFFVRNKTSVLSLRQVEFSDMLFKGALRGYGLELWSGSLVTINRLVNCDE